LKVFLDTNVLVSALATRGLCADLYERLLTEHQIIIGEPVVTEVLDILQRKFRADDTLLIKVEAELRLLHVVPAQATAPTLPIHDLDDPWIIACALQAKVECFVTGDAELLALAMVDNLPIISPRIFWDKYISSTSF
jgi:predicted nucleic acid-binding protein